MIVDLQTPRFDSGCIFSQDPAISYIWSQKNLNDDQCRAILKILTSKDYALILGMPTTGKTSNIVHAVKALLMRDGSWERQRQNEMKVVNDSDVPSQMTDGHNPGSAGSDPKRLVDGCTFLEDSKTPGSSGQPDEEFKPNAATEEMIINFLIRVALVIEPKEKESSVMYKQALEKQPHLFIRNNINQISQILEPCFKYKMLDAGKSLCALLKMVFVAFPLDVASTPPDVKLYQKVDELIQKNINTMTAPQTSSEDTSANSISFVLLVIKTLTEVQKSFIDPYILVRILQRLARDMRYYKNYLQ